MSGRRTANNNIRVLSPVRGGSLTPAVKVPSAASGINFSFPSGGHLHHPRKGVLVGVAQATRVFLVHRVFPTLHQGVLHIQDEVLRLVDLEAGDVILKIVPLWALPPRVLLRRYLRLRVVLLL